MSPKPNVPMYLRYGTSFPSSVLDQAYYGLDDRRPAFPAPLFDEFDDGDLDAVFLQASLDADTLVSVPPQTGPLSVAQSDSWLDSFHDDDDDDDQRGTYDTSGNEPRDLR